jgi:DNA-binding response OmpR family regulator
MTSRSSGQSGNHIRKPDSRTAGDSTSAAKKSPPPNVLIVDDEPLLRWSMAETLGESGYRVLQAEDAKGAIQAFEAAPKPPDVVLLDFDLPDSDGLRVLTNMRALSPSTPVILMTVFGSADLRERARELGAAWFVDKPFEMDALRTLVETVLNGAGPL